MKTRMLPFEEWGKLEALGPQMAPIVGPADARVLVVEDGDQIIACWSVMRVTYMESMTIIPQYRGNAGVVRRIVNAGFAEARKMGDWAFTGADNQEIGGYLVRLGGQPLPAMMFMLPLKGVH